ncbi:hypothetical protein QNO08_15490 [Arthrobacter sp. zg-Y820]|uniref:hypothetical protein n=1 Tax=unclassified Arthrobacter TaxID=235627 RepID=UPI001E29E237|nr:MULTISPECIES: hypothetical protein [unclassified Arthrobacter]MCC9197042.1 hypothetical protein [Arthrobacter sp. zg-Y820]MDK1279907.1 hypothetical protein [Arthrobacter sp. zg.Y820]WIB09209.1 hypothetical protein QNO08_15490 [Arthrobacter sp. zg-Y820]
MQGTTSVIKAVATWLLALMLTVAAAVVVIYFVNTKAYGPEHQVNSYFTALQEGDGERALGLLAARVPDANAALLDGDALKASTADLEVLDIAEPRNAGEDRVDLEVRYSLGGEEGTSTYRLERTDRAWLFFDRWSFAPAALPTLTVTAASQQSASVNGVQIALPEDTTTFAAFYPARVEVSYTSKYFAAPAESGLLASPRDTLDLVLTTEATQTLKDEVDADVRAFLAGCTAAQDRLAPPGCPFFHFTDRVELPIVWKITEYPEVKIRSVSGNWVLSPLSGKARLTTTQTDLFSGAQSPLEVEKDFSFAAKLAIGSDEVSVTPLID